MFNCYCNEDGYIEPAELQDALVDHLWGNTTHSTDILLEASSAKVSFDGFLKLSQKLSKDSFNNILDELNERDQAILVLTREHVNLYSPITTC